MRVFRRILPALTLLMSGLPALAEPPQVVEVATSLAGVGWRFDVTLSHPDTGWDHYADGWEVLDAAGNRLGYRELFHPHEEEQPFTRSLSNVMIPDGTTEVFIRARCNRDGWAGEMHRVTLTR
jgi:hypothetical protein